MTTTLFYIFCSCSSSIVHIRLALYTLKCPYFSGDSSACSDYSFTLSSCGAASYGLYLLFLLYLFIISTHLSIITSPLWLALSRLFSVFAWGHLWCHHISRFGVLLCLPSFSFSLLSLPLSRVLIVLSFQIACPLFI